MRIWYLIAYAPTPPIHTYADASGGARGQNFGPSLHLHPYFVSASNEGSGDSARTRRLAGVFVSRHSDTFQNTMCWLHIPVSLDIEDFGIIADKCHCFHRNNSFVILFIVRLMFLFH